MTARIAAAMAAAALVVALFGVTPLGQAAARLVVPSNSVGAKQLKRNAVTGLKVKDGSLTAADFRAGQLPAGPQGPKGDTGPDGAKGAAGAAGPTGISGYQIVDGAPVEIDVGYTNTARAYCPDGKQVLGGGIASYSGGGAPLAIMASFPPNPTAWEADAKNVGTANTHMNAYAICASVAK